MTIRLMRDEDVGRLIELGRLMHLESRYKHLDYSETKLAALADQILNDPSTWIALVYEDEHGDIPGMFVGYVTEHFFGYDKMSCDLLLYVRPDKRGSSIGPRLIKAYETIARDLGTKDMGLGATTNIAKDRTRQLYERLGYTTVGYAFRKD